MGVQSKVGQSKSRFFWTSDETLPAATSQWTEWIDVDDMRSRGPIVCGVGSTMDVPVTANDDSPGHAGKRVPSAPISSVYEGGDNIRGDVCKTKNL